MRDELRLRDFLRNGLRGISSSNKNKKPQLAWVCGELRELAQLKYFAQLRPRLSLRTHAAISDQISNRERYKLTNKSG